MKIFGEKVIIQKDVFGNSRYETISGLDCTGLVQDIQSCIESGDCIKSKEKCAIN